jgi:hypothetical protein
VHDRHADVDNDVLGCRVIQQVAEHLPAVQQGVALVKVILAAVSTAKKKTDVKQGRNFQVETQTNQISSSGPLLNLAPLCFASSMLRTIRLAFPSKSSAHWFRVHTATFARRPIAAEKSERHGKSLNGH